MISKGLKKKIVDEICRIYPAVLVFALYDAIMWIWYDEADQAMVWGE